MLPPSAFTVYSRIYSFVIESTYCRPKRKPSIRFSESTMKNVYAHSPTGITLLKASPPILNPVWMTSVVANPFPMFWIETFPSLFYIIPTAYMKRHTNRAYLFSCYANLHERLSLDINLNKPGDAIILLAFSATFFFPVEAPATIFNVSW